MRKERIIKNTGNNEDNIVNILISLYQDMTHLKKNGVITLTSWDRTYKIKRIK